MTSNANKIIRDGDVVFARVTLMGSTLMNARLDNVDSAAAVVDWVLRKLGDFTGMVKITLRNASRGWSSDIYRTALRTALAS